MDDAIAAIGVMLRNALSEVPDSDTFRRAFMAFAYARGNPEALALVKQYTRAGAEISLWNVPPESRAALVADFRARMPKRWCHADDC